MPAPVIAPVIAIDIGATTIKAGLLAWQPAAPSRASSSPTSTMSGEWTILARAGAATPGSRGAEAVLCQVTRLVIELSAAADSSRPGTTDGAPSASRPAAIGVASCGLVDRHGLVIETTDTMPGWDGTDIPAEIIRRTGIHCVADNDGNVAALGEALHGAGRGAASFAMLTLGTGVGGGVVIDGQVLHGAGSMAGTFGHLCVVPGGRRCACGAHGCLEAYASAWAMRRYAGADAEALFRRAEGADDADRQEVRSAIEHIDQAADALGRALGHIAHVLNPDIIAIGGGIARSWPRLRHRALTRFTDCTLQSARKTTRIAPARLGPDAGLIGAAALAAGHPQ